MATAERAVQRAGAGRHRSYGLDLPAAPTDEETTRYVDPNLALIIRTSLASFGALLISQARFVFLTPLLTWVFLPFVAFTTGYYLISLCVNAGTRGFDFEAHRELVRTWWPTRYPFSTTPPTRGYASWPPTSGSPTWCAPTGAG